MIDSAKIFSGGSVEIYDGDVDLAAAIKFNKTRRVTLYTKKKIHENDSLVFVKPYLSLAEASDCITNICMLDSRAIKLLVAMYPSAPKYVLVRLNLNFAWFLGMFGLIRRLLLKLVNIKGIISIRDIKDRKTFWLVLEQSGTDVHKIPVLSKNIGVAGFLSWLKNEKISYVVLRFYDNLPKLHRDAGDLDILVADGDMSKVKDFLQQNENKERDFLEDTRIGLHSVSGEPGLIPYYPPRLANQILVRSIDGPADSKIPSKIDSLNSLIYHALYHSKKGYSSGIPSNLCTHLDKYPENDYFGIIKKKAKELSIKVGDTMEEMDEYMAQEGWRPKLDTLAKIAENNAWVRDRFFKGHNHEIVGLAVFVMREWVRDCGCIEDVINYFDKQGFVVLRHKSLSTEEQQKVKNVLRGGTWGANKDGSTKGWLPAEVVIAIDKACVKLPVAYAVGFEKFRIRKLKELMRQKFDKNGMSSMHSTDNSRESWEYIEICFPEQLAEIRAEIKSYMKPSFFATFRHIFQPIYIKHAIKHSARGFIVRNFLS